MADDKGAPAEDQAIDPQDEMTLEDRLAKLEKTGAERESVLEEERKASAGKDKKITELTAERRKWQEDTLSKDQLLQLRADDQKKKEDEWAAHKAEEQTELLALRMELDKRTVLDSLEGFPSELAEYVNGSDIEEIETNARKLMALWTKDRSALDNVQKVTGVPRTGAKTSTVKAADLAGKGMAEQREFGANAEDDDFLQLVTDQQRRKG